MTTESLMVPDSVSPSPRVLDDDDLNTFWAQVNTHPASGDCWEWTGRRHPRTQQGKITLGYRQWAAHRLAYALANGPIPPGMVIMHTCRNPGCCNPSHLLLGTNADLAKQRRHLHSRGATSEAG